MPSATFAGNWARQAIILSGLFILLWGGTGLALLFMRPPLPDNVYVFLENVKRGLGGASCGLLIFLFVSNGFPKFTRK